MKNSTFWGLLILITMGCSEQEPVTPPADKGYVIGKNRFTLTIDGDSREYYVHVPANYHDQSPVPVVFMLHGTTGDGERFYTISGWKEVGEVENILTVFPSSWRYWIIDDGEVKNTTKWNIYPGAFEYCAGEVPRDDIKFLRQIVAELQNKFKVDSKRIYLAGFSNGGQMAFRGAVEMSDVFAAVVEASGSVKRDTTLIPKRDLPITFQVGNSDDLWLDSKTATVPMSLFESTLRTNPDHLVIIHTHLTTFHYDPNFVVSGDTNTVLVATYPGLPLGSNRPFNFMLIKGLDHNYPNGINHWFKGAEQHWAWMKQYSRP